MKKGIALIGVGDNWWVRDLLSNIEEGFPQQRISWSYRIRPKMEPLLRNQIKKFGHLKILFYQPIREGGPGRVTLVASATDFESIQVDSKKRTRFVISEYQHIDPPMELSLFWRFEDRGTVTPSMMRSSFAYVADVKKLSTKPIEAWEDLELKEDYLEDMLARNPSLFGLGRLELIDRQMRMANAGVADLVLKKGNRTIIVVEVKKGLLKKKDVAQLKKYLKWAHGNYPSVEGILVGWDSSDTVEQAVTKLREQGYDVTTMIYNAKLRLCNRE